jgi:DMSO/TMAO reductase YedYZ heme-binding membrane subunit
MLDDLLSALVGIVIALIVAFPLGKVLKKRPGVFYLIAAVVVCLYVYYLYGPWFRPSLQPIVEPIRKGYIASTFLALVMFTGVLNEGSALRKKLQPIRAELSILSLIMFCAHIATFLPSYYARFTVLVSMGNLMSYSIIMATILTVIYVVLSLLSLRVFRTKMQYKSWKNIQRLSYVMVALLTAHIWLALGKGALKGGSATVTVAFYTVVIVLYAVLRIRKGLADTKRRADRAAALDAEKAIVQEQAAKAE